MLVTVGVGILVSVAAEVVTWINKKVNGTVLSGKGAFLLALAVALMGAGMKVSLSGAVITWGSLGTTLGEIWVVAQVFFVFIVKTLNLDVKDVQVSASTV